MKTTLKKPFLNSAWKRGEIWKAVLISAAVAAFAYLFILQVPGVVSRRYLFIAFLAGLGAGILYLVLLRSVTRNLAQPKAGKSDTLKLLLGVAAYTITYILLFGLPNAYLLAPRVEVRVEVPAVEEGGANLRLSGISNGMRDVSFKELQLTNAQMSEDSVVLMPAVGAPAVITWQGDAWRQIWLEFDADQAGIPIQLALNGKREVLDSKSGVFDSYLQLINFKKVQNLSYIICLISLTAFIFCALNLLGISGKVLIGKINAGNELTSNRVFKTIHFYTKRLIRKSLSNEILIMILCFLLSALFLLIATKSSPLYPLNDWVDANSFFTVGKGMINGKVPYRDLFEQKGPLLYFIQGLAYLISNRTFFGVYVFETIFFAFFLFYSYKIIKLFINVRYTLFALPLISAHVLNMRSFALGNSAEEFCLPLMAISLFYLLWYLKEFYLQPMPKKWLFFNGIIAGCVLWIKYSILGFWLGWMTVLFFSLAFHQPVRRAILACIIFGSGILVASLPWLVYFAANHALYDWINTYFLINIQYYRQPLNLIQSVQFTLKQLWSHTQMNGLLGFALWAGVGLFLILNIPKFKFIKRVGVVFCLFVLVYGVYGGGQGTVYYSLILTPYIVFLYLGILIIFGQKVSIDCSMKTTIYLFSLICLVLFTMTLKFNHNTTTLNTKREDLVQYRFARIMNATKDTTLLNYGSLDMGLYTVTGIVPNLKYFQQQNLEYSQYPINKDEQDRYLNEKLVEYVVLRIEPADSEILNSTALNENYELISTETQKFKNDEVRYFLYKIKGS